MVKTKMGMKIAFVKSSGLSIALTVPWRFMMRKILLTAVMITYVTMGGAALPLHGHNDLLMSVSGCVRDVNSKQPVSGVEVYIFKRENGELTEGFKGKSGKNGYYSIDYLEAGDYIFSVCIPDIGDVYIMTFGNGGEPQKGYYDLEVVKGRHGKLNIFIGENSYPYIERYEDIVLNEVNVTMLYKLPWQRKARIAEGALESSIECEGLVIDLPDENGTEIDDDKPLKTADGKECEALFDFQFSFSGLAECKNGKCDFSKMFATCDVNILRRKKSWYYSRYPERSKELNDCHRACAFVHEQVHYNDFLKNACPRWIEAKQNLKAMELCCKGESKAKHEVCKKHLRKVFSSLNMDVAQAITEDNAYAAEYECEKSCSGM